MVELRRCTNCGRRFPATYRYFYDFWSQKNYLRPMCKGCCRKAHRRYIRANKQKEREYNRRDYRKYRHKRIANVMRRYWEIRANPRLYAIYLAKKRGEYARRVMKRRATGRRL